MAARKKEICIFVVGLLSIVYCLAGCASLKEGTKCVLGISTKALEDGRKDAIKKTFAFDYNTSYGRVKQALKDKEAYIYAQDSNKGLIAVYAAPNKKAAAPGDDESIFGDTTPVGVFITQTDAAHTQIEVSSPSTYDKEYIAKIVFSALEEEANAPSDK